MKKEYKEKWLAVLRSGKYRQGVGYLRCGKDSYCCLGVLCDIVDNEGWQKSERGYEFGEKFDTLPDEVVKLVGLNDDNPWIEVNGKTEVIAEVNDQGYSFEEIADIIEAQL